MNCGLAQISLQFVPMFQLTIGIGSDNDGIEKTKNRGPSQ